MLIRDTAWGFVVAVFVESKYVMRMPLRSGVDVVVYGMKGPAMGRIVAPVVQLGHV
jgi:hypothetical protein